MNDERASRDTKRRTLSAIVEEARSKGIHPQMESNTDSDSQYSEDGVGGCLRKGQENIDYAGSAHTPTHLMTGKEQETDVEMNSRSEG